MNNAQQCLKGTSRRGDVKQTYETFNNNKGNIRVIKWHSTTVTIAKTYQVTLQILTVEEVDYDVLMLKLAMQMWRWQQTTPRSMGYPNL
jgi:hypothetical protein